MSQHNQRLRENLFRDVFVFEDEQNPRTSQIYRIFPVTVLDQVFDQLSPSHKNLREILDDLRHEILTGGLGNIVFPVTSVNGQTNDVSITQADVGLGRVDNTRDLDKPLSTPQRRAIMDILSTYNFDVNLDSLYAHLIDQSNPHGTSVEQLDFNSELTQFTNRLIMNHNISTASSTHFDIRRQISTLWARVDHLDLGLEERIAIFLDTLDGHISDPNAHSEIFDTKEDVSNKVWEFHSTTNNDHSSYPSTRAVIDYYNNRFNAFSHELSQTLNHISDLNVISSEDKLPPDPNESHFRRAYLLNRRGPGGDQIYLSLAVCRRNTDGTYFWDIQNTDAVSVYDPKYFKRSPDGLTLDIPAIFSDSSNIDALFGNLLDANNLPPGGIFSLFIRDIEILPGTMNGTIRWRVNKDNSTLSEDLRIPGLGNLAFSNWITEGVIRDLAVQERHIGNRVIVSRHLSDDLITIDHIPNNIPITKLQATQGRILGNLMNTDGQVQEITLHALADVLRPFIGGWPDPSVPGSGGHVSVSSPHTLENGIAYELPDMSQLMVFRGTISVLPNVPVRMVLEPSPAVLDPPTSRRFRLLEAGGSWCIASDTKQWSPLGGSNLTGHTYGQVVMDRHGMMFESLSTGLRVQAPFELWIKYLPYSEDPWLFEDPWLTDNWYDDPELTYVLPAEERPNGQVNFVLERITHLVTAARYEVGGITYTAESNFIPIQEDWFNTFINIIRLGNDITTRNSVPQHLHIPARALRPDIDPVHTNNAINDGALLGVTDEMEFKLSTTQLWLDAAVNATTGLIAGEYEIRLKATPSSFPGQIRRVIIN